jgi:signal transduction histidine kinase
MRLQNVDEDASLIERATHDLLNPIASLLGLGETLASRGADLDDATLRSFGTSVARQAGRLEAAVRDLARAAMLGRGDLPVSPAEVSVTGIVSDLASERVRVDAPDGLTASADAGLLSDALTRLVGNALQFSGAEVSVRAGRNGGPWIEVEDRGTGFTDESLAQAFEPLSAGANTRNDRGGLGLGLYIARRLVEAQGGTLTARSTPGEGSVFRIELPA